jgi:hypothetical protein
MNPRGRGIVCPMTLASNVPIEYFFKERVESDIVEVEKLSM